MVRLPASASLRRGWEAADDEGDGGADGTPVHWPVHSKLCEATPEARSCQGFQSPMDSFFDPRTQDFESLRGPTPCQSPMDRFFDGPELPSFFEPGPAAAPTPQGCLVVPVLCNAWTGAADGTGQVWLGTACPPQVTLPQRTGGVQAGRAEAPARPVAAASGPVPPGAVWAAKPSGPPPRPSASHPAAATNGARGNGRVVPGQSGPSGGRAAASKANLSKAQTQSEQRQPLPPGPVAVYVDLSSVREKKLHQGHSKAPGQS